jgi:putative transposase
MVSSRGDSAVRRAFKFRLRANATHERGLATMRETHRRLYNACLAERKTAYQTQAVTLKYTDQSARFTEARKSNPFYARINFSSAQATMRRLDKAYNAFFRRVKAGKRPGFPRFKGRDRFDSVAFPRYGDGIKLNGSKLKVQHVGEIPVILHRPIQGRINTVTLKHEAGKWYVVFSCDLPDIPIVPNDRPPVGIDVGLESFLRTSDGGREPNPRDLKDALPSLRRQARAVARKQKGGKNRRKAVKRLQQIHARVKNLRHQHHHEVALKLVRRYGFIVAESLNPGAPGLTNGRLARSISDAGWSGFLLTLRCKAESAGIAYVEVDARGTSQRCSGCGATVRKSLSDRWHACPECGLSLHRDENSAREILRLGLLVRNGPVDANAGAA